MVVADLSNVAILSNACWGSPRSKNEAMGAKIHQTPFRLSMGCLSSRINKILVLNMNENFSTKHPSKALHFFHSAPYGLETIAMRFGGVKNPSGLQEKQISMEALEVSMVFINSICNAARATRLVRTTYVQGKLGPCLFDIQCSWVCCG